LKINPPYAIYPQ